MAETEVQRCLDWLLEQKGDFEQSSFGSCKQSVNEATNVHSRKRSKLSEYRKHMDKVSSVHTLNDDEMHSLYGTYQAVQSLSEKRSGCFEVIKGIAALEDHIQNLSTEVDNKAVHLVNLIANNKQKNGHGLNNESMAKTTQNCMSAVRQTWKWLDEVMQCSHVHLANAAAYHEFFHDVEEVDYWMNNTMSSMHLSFSKQKLNGDRGDLNDINGEMKDTLFAYLRWQSKVDNLFTRARDIVPVNKRTSPVKEPCHVLALANYKTEGIEFKEGETLQLLDNTDKSKWLVKNGRDQQGLVPAVIILINGPSGEAVDAAIRLRLQLLGLWTTSIKRLGFQMIAFMQLVFKDWSDEEIKAIQNMPSKNRDELLRILTTVESTLQTNWQGYEGFTELQERIGRLRTILDEADKVKGAPNEVSGAVVIQVRMLEKLLNSYQEFWTYWETYKVVVELLRNPKYILVCDKWEQLKFSASAHFVKFWDTNLQLPKGDGKTYKAEAALTLFETPKSQLSTSDDVIKPEAVDEVMSAQRVEKTDSTVADALGKLGDEYTEDEEITSSSTDITEVRRRQQLTTDEVVQSSEEVRQTFLIKTVTDPRTQEEISLKDAIMAGIIDQAAGLYVNPQTGKSVSLQAAMGQGDISVEFKSQRKIREERSSYGIITVKTSKETRPYSIISVLDPKTDQEMPIEAAYQRGILSRDQPTYKTEKGEIISLMDAIHSGLVKAQFQGAEEDTEEEETKTYAVNGVVNQRTKNKVSFSDALRNGLLEAEEGVYVNNVTWERVPITEAIMRGFIKARIVTDTSVLDIDPSNKIVVKRMNSLKEKVVKAVKVSKAFKWKSSEVNGQKH